MKFLILLVVVASAYAQRPSFAGTSAKGYPELASRFRTDGTSTSSPTTGNAAGSSVGNRLGGDNSISTEKIPVDARGDADLVNRLNQWPRENRPFWLLNAEAIEAQRDPQGARRPSGSQAAATPVTQNRGAFLNRAGISGVSASDPNVFTNEAGDILVPVDTEDQLRNLLYNGSVRVFAIVPNRNAQPEQTQSINSQSRSQQSSGVYGR